MATVEPETSASAAPADSNDDQASPTLEAQSELPMFEASEVVMTEPSVSDEESVALISSS